MREAGLRAGASRGIHTCPCVLAARRYSPRPPAPGRTGEGQTVHIRVLDLDGALNPQRQLHRLYRPAVHEARAWGPHVRLGCSFGRFRRFAAAADALLRDDPPGPALTFYGSGDFHHVSLALLRRLKGPFNLLVLD